MGMMTVVRLEERLDFAIGHLAEKNSGRFGHVYWSRLRSRGTRR